MEDCRSVVGRKTRLRWLGHVERKEDSATAKAALLWIPDEKRNRCRPWKDIWRDIEPRLLKPNSTALYETDGHEMERRPSQCTGQRSTESKYDSMMY